MIILFGSQKGGTGKSTLSASTAAYLAGKGKDVILVDADPQGTTASWAEAREELSLPRVNFVEKSGSLKKSLLDLKERYECIVVDCAGKDSKELRTALLVADVCFIPCQPSQADLDTLEAVSEIIETAKDLNEELKIYTLLNRVPTNPKNKETIESMEFIREYYADLNPIDQTMRDLKVHRNALRAGKGVTEYKNEKGAWDLINIMESTINV